MKNILSARCSQRFKRARRRSITHARQGFPLPSLGSPPSGNGEDGAWSPPYTLSLHTLSPNLALGRLQGGINRQQHSPERRAGPSQVCCRQPRRRSGPGSELPARPGSSPGHRPSHSHPRFAFPLTPYPTPAQNLRPVNNESLGFEFSSANTHSWG